MKHRVLVVDDEKGIREALKQVLEYEGLQVRLATTGVEGILAYNEYKPHLVILDVKMAGMNGLDTLAQLGEQDHQAPVVMISGHGTIATAVEATQRGAFDFLEKPLDTDRLLVTVRNALSQSKLAVENVRLRKTVATRYTMVGESHGLKVVRDLIEKVAPTNARVMITGDNGTGKELVARAIHDNSPRKSGPFVEVNCAAIPSELIESELFGHIKGSFTGAVSDRTGKFELADEGTLFLDEIGDMALPAQAKVLRVLQQGQVTRIGGSKVVEVDVRVIAATNKDVAKEIEEGRFREDLFYRLNVVPIYVPRLSERTEDIPGLVDYFAKRLAENTAVPAKSFAKDAIRRLRQRDWPGNVRELRNAIERLLILAPGKEVTAEDVGHILGDMVDTDVIPPKAVGPKSTFESFRMEAERAFLAAKLREYDWNIIDCAKAIKLTRSALYGKIKQYGLKRDDTP